MDMVRYPWIACLATLLAMAEPGAVSMSNRCQAAPEDKTPAQGGQNLEMEVPEDDTGLAEDVFFRANRTTRLNLLKARQLNAQGRYSEAVRYLGTILEADEDYFFQPDEKVPIHRSLKAEAQRLIGEMPSKGREVYELQYGAHARELLSASLVAGDADGLAEVSRKFFHTQAGYEATMLLGLHHFDHGRPLAAALTLRRLRQACPYADRFEPALSLTLATCWNDAGMEGEARRVLADMKSRLAGNRVVIGGSEVPLFASDDESLEWLAAQVGPHPLAGEREPEQWAMYRGNPARNTLTSASAPLLSLRWHVPITDDPGIERLLDQAQQTYLEQDMPIVPRLYPLAVGNVVLMRTCRNLLAVDFETGKRLWEVPVDSPIDGAMIVDGLNAVAQRSNQLAMALRQRIWEDATFGTMSSDGHLVFTVEDLGVQNAAAAYRQVIINGQRQPSALEPRAFNRLAAHDIRTGKLKWNIGGPKEEYALRQAETFFLGPPLPLMGQLYVLGEVESEIRLMALDAETGNLLWSQQLAMVEQSILQDPLRRLSGLSPAYADGVLICPTASGAVVGIELATRSLLWGYRYSRSDEVQNQPQIMAMRMGIYGGDGFQRWIDSGMTIVDGCVLTTPVESNELHCLNLIDGKLLWKAERRNDLYLAGVFEGKVVLVGTEQVRALEMADGSAAWGGAPLALPERARPSGRGLIGGKNLFLPLTTGDVAVIDLEQGAITRFCRSRDAVIPGNLIAYRGRILSQSVSGVDNYYQIGYLHDAVEKRLAGRTDDAEMLALRGEIRLDEGKRAEAVDDFRRALGIAADPRTRQLLRESLLEGLRTNFADNVAHADEIERLLDDADQQAAYQRLMAAGLQASGLWQSALERYQKLIALDTDYRTLEPIDDALQVRRDRWVEGQLAAMREQAPAGVRDALDAYIDAQLDAALASPTPDTLRKFLDYFGYHPLPHEAQQRLGHRLQHSGHLLQAELLLWREYLSPDPTRAGQAAVSLAELLRGANRFHEAAVYYRELGEQWADVVCRPGKTGRQLAAEAAEDPLMKAHLSTANEWPVGRVEVEEESPKRPRTPSYGRFALPYESTAGPFFHDTTIEYDQNTRSVFGRDGYGNRQWEVSLAEQGQGNSMPFNRNLTFAKGQGHLLMLSMDYQLLAIDTLGTAGGKPRLLWAQDLSEPQLGPTTQQIIVRAGPWGVNRVHIRGRFGGDSTTALGPVTERAVCYVRFRRCVALDPLTGETLWIRDNIPSGSAVFGDEQYTFIVPPDAKEAIVVRTDDGSLCEPREVPADAFRLTTDGRDLITWQPADVGYTLERFDPWEQRAEWEVTGLARDTRTALIPGESAALLESNGRFRLVSLQSGEPIVDASLEADSNVIGIQVLRLGEMHFLVLNRRPLPSSEPKPTQPVPGYNTEPVVNGLVYAFDRDGRPAWPKPVVVENQHVLLNQPGLLPVIAFACQVHDRSAEGQNRARAAILCIDKRTGRVVLSESLPYITSTFEIGGDPADDVVEVRLQQNTLSMKFTGEPLAPETEETTPQDVTTTDALLDAARRAWRQSDAGEEDAKSHTEPAPEAEDSPDSVLDEAAPAAAGL